MRCVECLCGFILLAMPIRAADDESRGMIFYERFLGSSNTLGSFFRLDTTLGYSFNKYFSVDGGLPVFFVRPSETTTPLTGVKSTNGIGNAYLELRLTLANPLLDYSAVVTGTAPTGDKNAGLSTGRATIDWTNRFHRSFSRITPFGAVGFANTVSDTPLFIRPYTTLGFVTHFEGGGTYRVARFLDAGASAYAIEPGGQQTVVSQLLTKTPAAPAQPGRGNGRNSRQGVFETTPVAVGTPDLVRDHGFSFWGSVHPTKMVELQVAYTRSVHYALNTVSFGIGVNLASVVRNMRSY